MAEETITIKAGDLEIEALLENYPGDLGVVVTHPHPLYGGDMHNNVVEAVIRAYREVEYTTLRFNFRGAGSSQGDYDNGIGEQDDVKAALSYLADLGKKHLDLVGYSFGAWVIALGLETFEKVDRLIMISPPVGLLDFDPLAFSNKIQLVIAGTHDDIARVEAIEKKMSVWNPEAVLHVIQDADHFYMGKAKDIEAIIHKFLTETR